MTLRPVARIAGASTNFIIGGSQWETGVSGVWQSDAAAKVFSPGR
jgi:hypothetical protein